MWLWQQTIKTHVLIQISVKFRFSAVPSLNKGASSLPYCTSSRVRCQDNFLTGTYPYYPLFLEGLEKLHNYTVGFVPTFALPAGGENRTQDVFQTPVFGLGCASEPCKTGKSNLMILISSARLKVVFLYFLEYKCPWVRLLISVQGWTSLNNKPHQSWG